MILALLSHTWKMMTFRHDGEGLGDSVTSQLVIAIWTGVAVSAVVALSSSSGWHLAQGVAFIFGYTLFNAFGISHIYNKKVGAAANLLTVPTAVALSLGSSLGLGIAMLAPFWLLGAAQYSFFLRSVSRRSTVDT